MTILEARKTVRQFGRNAGEESYSDAEIDRAIMTVGGRFATRTRCIRQVHTLALTASDFNLPAFSTATPATPTPFTMFRPERLLSAWIEDSTGRPREPLVVASTLSLVNNRRTDGLQTTWPTLLAFTSYTTGELYPTPSSDCTLRIEWYADITRWATGSAAEAVINAEINIPADLLDGVLTYGAPAQLQASEPEQGYAQQAWAKYLEHERMCMGRNGMGGRVAFSDPETTPRPRRVIYETY